MQISHYRTEDYDRYEEDSDEYEEEASEHDGEDEQEAPKPTKEEQEFLSVREQLKDRIRKKLKKQNARALGHSSQTQDKRRTTTNATLQPGGFLHQSLVSGPVEDARYAQTSVKSQLPMNQPAQLVSVANGLRNPDSGKQHIQRKTGFAKEAPLNRPLPALTDSRKILSGAVGNGCSKPMGTNPSQRVVGNGCSKPMGTNPSQRVVGNGSSKPMGTNPSQRVVGNGSSKPMVTNLSQRAVGNGSSRPVVTNPSQRVVGNGSSRPVVTNPSQRVVGNGSSRPVVTNPSQRDVGNGSSRPMVSNSSQRVIGNGSSKPMGNSSSQRMVPIQAAGANKLLSKVINDPYLKKDISASKPHSSALKHYPEQKRLTQGLDQVKTTAKQPMPPSKSQVCLCPHCSEGMDEDDSDMEVGFDVIQKEERISSKIARKEDEEQLRLIEEEEERERQMRRRMKKKLKH
ncbi:hypothetical protein BHE74_00007033 [Ensete ventricosum]|nr:hypothetical protein BHE74_00007033 [Ensete ventricosum]